MKDSEAVVIVYTRPGCPFSAALRWQLRRLAVPVREINIWADRGAAGVVREITGGDETVPTVVVGAQTMVNPGVDQVRAALAAVAPQVQIAAPRSTAALVARGMVGPAVMLGVWAAVALLFAPTVFHLGPALVAASLAVTARMDAARGLGFTLGAVLAAAGAVVSTAALLVLPVFAAAAPSLPETVFAVAVVVPRSVSSSPAAARSCRVRLDPDRPRPRRCTVRDHFIRLLEEPLWSIARAPSCSTSWRP